MAFSSSLSERERFFRLFSVESTIWAVFSFCRMTSELGKAAAIALSEAISEAGFWGGRKLATVGLLFAAGGGGATGAAFAGGAVFLAVVRGVFLGFVLAGGGSDGIRATSGTCTSGSSGISSGSATATVGANERGGNTGFFLLQASANNKASRRSEVTSLRNLII